MKLTNAFAAVNGAKVFYQTAGEGFPLIFVHGNSLDSRMWSEQLKYFSKKYQVYCYDVRGFGKSDLPSDKPYSFFEDLNNFCNYLLIKKAHIIGLSLGGAIAIDFALSHPEKIKSLGLVDSGISGDGFSKSFLGGMIKVKKLIKEGKINKAKAEWLNFDIFSFSRKKPVIWKKIKTMVKQTSTYIWYGKNLSKQLNPQAIERLQEIQIPTLILVGEHDTKDFHRKAKRLNASIKNSQLEIIYNAGHMCNMDNPREFNRKVDIFLSSIDNK